uniref:Oligomerization domain protein n=1 Tax=Toxoplasma gondii TgCATBr9 TaxID=943120 RepID=A0A2T6IPA2_TOXGO|nr:oligomerization domain protein [Toxoplasma gondii TgCATBr9]
MENSYFLLVSSVIVCIFGRVLLSSIKAEAITIHRDIPSHMDGFTHVACTHSPDATVLRSLASLVHSACLKHALQPQSRCIRNPTRPCWRRPSWDAQEGPPSMLMQQANCRLAARSFIPSHLIRKLERDGCRQLRKFSAYKTLNRGFSTARPFGQQNRRYVWSEGSGFGSCYAIPLVTGLTRSSDKNQKIPQFLLPPLFTAVRAGDKHKAQSIIALWKKPGVQRMGWVDDRQPSGREQQLIRDSTNEANEPRTIGDNSGSQADGTSPGSEKAELTAQRGSDGLAPQGEGMVIMTGTCASHLDSLAEAVIAAMWEDHMRKLLGRDGRGYSGWVVLAFMDLEIHIMTPIMRERYALEELYGLCPRIDISDCIRVDSMESFDLYREGFRTFGSTDCPFSPEGI